MADSFAYCIKSLPFPSFTALIDNALHGDVLFNQNKISIVRTFVNSDPEPGRIRLGFAIIDSNHEKGRRKSNSATRADLERCCPTYRASLSKV
jgi:hypothetical protein